MNLIIKKIKYFAKFYPNNLAIDDHNIAINYKDFYKYINKFSHYINTINKKKIIIIYGEIKYLSYIAIFSSINNNLTYVPISSGTPLKRINEIVKQVKPEIFINCSKKILPLSPKVKIVNFYSIDFINNIILSKRRKKNNKNNNLAYIIFTSGSTGKPKGVCISRKSLYHYIKWLNKNFFIGPNKKCSQYSEIGFDLSVADIFATITSGGTVVPIENQYDKIFFGEFINKNNITHAVLVPSVINLMHKAKQIKKKYLKRINTIFLCGETLFPDQVQKIFKVNKKIKILSTYGPTEFTVSCSSCSVLHSNLDKYTNNSISFGKPIKGINFKIDKNKKKGELLISGPQMFTNYFNQRKLYNNRIVIINNKKYYLTGDIVEIINNNFYFCHRKDRQIKKNGYRIELEEIDIAVKKELKCFSYSLYLHNKYIVTVVNSKIKNNYIKKKIECILPLYMNPDYIFKIKQVYQNKNNKIDIAKLEAYAKSKLNQIISRK
jgi:D-alanine--poly(phosphoribitol) ligase subunit 1